MWITAVIGQALAQDLSLVGVDDPDRPPRAAIEALGGEILRCYRSSRVCLARGVDPERLASVPGVRHAERDRPIQVLASGVDVEPTTACPDPWEHDFIGTPAVWPETCGAGAPVLAIEDSGFRLDHVELQGRIAGGRDYGDGDDLPEVSPLAGVPEHGTFIAGVASANADGFGRTGIAPEGSLFLQKIADSDGALYFSYAIEAMDDIAANHPEVGVLNYSIAAVDAPPSFLEAVEGLLEADILLVAAAANCFVPNCQEADNDTNPVYPSSYDLPHIVSVSSLMPDGRLDPMSHYGATSVTLAAPGADLCSLGVDSDDAMLTASGTSYAAPVVAAAATLLREAAPRLTAPETAEILERSCAPDDALTDRVRCGGALSVERALQMPLVSLDVSVDSLLVAPREDLTLSLDSRAAGGELLAVITHPSWLEVDDPGAVPFEEGDMLPFPAETEAETSGSWLLVDLPDDETFDLVIPLRALADGQGEVAVSLHPLSGEIAGLGPDLSTVAIDAVQDKDRGDRRAPKDRAEAGGCGCQTSRPFAPLAIALAALSLVRRR